jgi:hypothetical protein
MEPLAAPGSLCLAQHLSAEGVSPPQHAEDVVARRSDSEDPELGEFTLKRLAQRDGRPLSEPPSQVPQHRVLEAGAEGIALLAHFLGVLEAKGGWRERSDKTC